MPLRWVSLIIFMLLERGREESGAHSQPSWTARLAIGLTLGVGTGGKVEERYRSRTHVSAAI